MNTLPVGTPPYNRGHSLSDASTAETSEAAPVSGRVSSTALSVIEGASPTPTSPLLTFRATPTPPFVALRLAAAVEFPPLTPAYLDPSPALIEFINIFSSSESEYSLFLGLFLLFTRYLSVADEENLLFLERFIQHMAETSIGSKHEGFEALFAEVQDRLNTALAAEGLPLLTSAIAAELSTILSRFPLLSMKKVLAKIDFSKCEEAQRGPALLHFIDRMLILSYIHVFTIHSLLDVKEYTRHGELIIPSIARLPALLTISRKPSAYGSVIQTCSKRFNEPYPAVIVRNIRHCLVSEDVMMPLLGIRNAYAEHRITIEEALTALSPYADLLLDHTTTGINGLKAMLQDIREGIHAFAAVLCFPGLLANPDNFSTTKEVEGAVQAYVATQLEEASKAFEAREKAVYAYYLNQKRLFRLLELLGMNFFLSSRADEGLGKILRPLVVKPTARPVSPKKPVRKPKAQPPAEKAPMSGLHPPLVKDEVKPAHSHPTSLRHLFLSTIPIGGLSAYGAVDSLQIALSYALVLFQLGQQLRYDLTPGQVAHYLLDVAVAGQYCAEQMATLLMVVSQNTKSREDLEALTLECGHDVNARLAKASSSMTIPPDARSFIEATFNQYTRLEYAIRALPKVDKRQPQLVQWEKLHEHTDPSLAAMAGHETATKAQDTLRAFFHLARSVPTIAAVLNEPQIGIWDAIPFESFKIPLLIPQDPRPFAVSAALADLETMFHSLKKSSHKEALSFALFLQHQLERIDHFLVHFSHPDLVDFMFGQIRLHLFQILEEALFSSSERRLLNESGVLESHLLSAKAKELGISDFESDEIALINAAKAERNQARYDDMRFGLRRIEDTLPLTAAAKAACALSTHVASAAGEEERFISVKSSRQIEAEKILSIKLPLFASAIGKILTKRGLLIS